MTTSKSTYYVSQNEKSARTILTTTRQVRNQTHTDTQLESENICSIHYVEIIIENIGQLISSVSFSLFRVNLGCQILFKKFISENNEINVK